jgi:hypothetical protein
LETQYSFLKLATKILKTVSFLVGALGLISALIILFGKTPNNSKMASLGVLFVGGLYFLLLYLLAEIIRLFINIEGRLENIEKTIQTSKREIR